MKRIVRYLKKYLFNNIITSIGYGIGVTIATLIFISITSANISVLLLLIDFFAIVFIGFIFNLVLYPMIFE